MAILSGLLDKWSRQSEASTVAWCFATAGLVALGLTYVAPKIPARQEPPVTCAPAVQSARPY